MPLKSRTMPPAMHQCYHSCLLDQSDANEAIASVAMAPTTAKPAMRPSRYTAYRRLSNAQKRQVLERTLPWPEMCNAIPHAMRYLGRRIWKEWTCYHRRILMETPMRCF